MQTVFLTVQHAFLRIDIMVKTTSNSTVFHEVQRFNQKWPQILLIGISLCLIIPFAYGMVKQLLFNQPWGNNPLPDFALVVVGTCILLAGIGLPWCFSKLKLITEVRNDGVYINYFPLARRTVLYENIDSCGVRTYKPIREYGGWGVRCGRNGKAYTVSGNMGVQLLLLNGKEILVGSKRSEELAQAIKIMMRK